jgi:hypothetical protein
MYTREHRNIRGYQQTPVPHSFFRQKDETSHLALVLAGGGNNCQHPTLYYPTRELLTRGADALLVDYGLRPEFSSFTEEQIMACVVADCLAASEAVWGERPYARVTLIGKSLGTLAMGHLLASVPSGIQMQAIWLTPLLTVPELGRQIRGRPPRSLFIIGTEDPWYDAGKLTELLQVTQGESLVIPGANHLLESAEGTIASLQVMEQVVRALHAFLAVVPNT